MTEQKIAKENQSKRSRKIINLLRNQQEVQRTQISKNEPGRRTWRNHRLVPSSFPNFLRQKRSSRLRFSSLRLIGRGPRFLPPFPSCLSLCLHTFHLFHLHADCCLITDIIAVLAPLTGSSYGPITCYQTRRRGAGNHGNEITCWFGGHAAGPFRVNQGESATSWSGLFIC